MAELDKDYLLALQLQEQFNQENESRPTVVTDNNHMHEFPTPNQISEDYVDDVLIGEWVPKSVSSAISSESDNWSVVDIRWENIDPLPDARAMFMTFNDKYFWGRLAGVEVRWSPRMTSCAGLCCYEGRGGLCSVRLSEPLLKLRPRSDFVNTLLHEMIHAYLFVTDNNKDHDGHGPEFHSHMYRINKASGSDITVYHTFHDEVANYKQHWWRCDGPCQKWSPYYGYVKRAMNRAPAPYDTWWSNHQRKCGGTYTKVKEPEGYAQKKSKKKEKEIENKPPEKPKGTRDIRDLFGSPGNSNKNNDKPGAKNNELPPNVMTYNTLSDTDPGSDVSSQGPIQTTSAFPGEGKTLGWSAPNQGPIVRRLPGIGLISSGRPGSSQASATITSLDQIDGDSSDNKTTELRPNGNDKTLSTQSSKVTSKRPFSDIISDSDSNEDILFPIKKQEKRQRTGPFDKYGLSGCTSPGISRKIPGFTSVSNKRSKPSVMDSRAADRNRRAMELTSSEESETDDVPLSSAIQPAKANNNFNSDSGRTFGRNENISPEIPVVNSDLIIPDMPLPSSDNFLGAVNRVVVPGPVISLPSTDELVECPVCQTKVLNSVINAHLDMCMS